MSLDQGLIQWHAYYAASVRLFLEFSLFVLMIVKMLDISVQLVERK